MAMAVLGFEPGTAIEVGSNIALNVIFGLESGFLNVAGIGVETSIPKSHAFGLRFFASYEHIYLGWFHCLGLNTQSSPWV